MEENWTMGPLYADYPAEVTWNRPSDYLRIKENVDWQMKGHLPVVAARLSSTDLLTPKEVSESTKGIVGAGLVLAVR